MQSTKSDKRFLKIFLEIGEALIKSGAEIFRVEDTLNRMAKACGALDVNVFVITSSIVITIEFPDGEVLTQTKRVRNYGNNDFIKLGQLNEISREFCASPFSSKELEQRILQICNAPNLNKEQLLGNIIAGVSFTVFFGGNLIDGIIGGLAAIWIWILQQYVQPYCMNQIAFQFVVSFLTSSFICVFCTIFPFLSMNKIMIGDIMLIVPGLMATNALRDVLIGDTISGIMRFIEATLLAAVLALGFIAAMCLFHLI